MVKNKKLSMRQIKAQKQMDDAIFDIICAANRYASAEKVFYGRKLKTQKRLTILHEGNNVT